MVFLQKHCWLSFLLIMSGAVLTVMVPGGPVETRMFAHYSPLVLGAFNSFLTVLGLASFVLAWFAFREKGWALTGAIFCGIGYLLVYALDLAVIFPVSPDPMPQALLILEIVGIALSLPLIWIAFAMHQKGRMAQKEWPHLWSLVTGPAVMLGIAGGMLAIAIIAFATLAAMGT